MFCSLGRGKGGSRGVTKSSGVRHRQSSHFIARQSYLLQYSGCTELIRARVGKSPIVRRLAGAARRALSAVRPAAAGGPRRAVGRAAASALVGFSRRSRGRRSRIPTPAPYRPRRRSSVLSEMTVRPPSRTRRPSRPPPWGAVHPAVAHPWPATRVASVWRSCAGCFRLRWALLWLPPLMSGRWLRGGGLRWTPLVSSSRLSAGWLPVVGRCSRLPACGRRRWLPSAPPSTLTTRGSIVFCRAG